MLQDENIWIHSPLLASQKQQLLGQLKKRTESLKVIEESFKGLQDLTGKDFDSLCPYYTLTFLHSW